MSKCAESAGAGASPDMRLITPKYYDNFSCRAGDCTDSCCIGWEIGIDEKTLKKYSSIGGDIGERLSRGICRNEDGAHFKLSGERCPFLNEKNLCDLIIELGEGYLCDICREHPRYYLTLGEDVLCGVGMCCEAAAELILQDKNPGEYTVHEGVDAEYEECDSELYEIVFSAKSKVMECVRQSKSLYSMLCESYEIIKSAQEKIDLAPYKTPKKDVDFAKERFVSLFYSAEYRRGELLPLLKDAVSSWNGEVGKETLSYLKNVFAYFIDRYLPIAVCDGDAVSAFAVAVVSTVAIAALFSRESFLTLARAVDICKSYSSEIEYNEDNVALIQNSADELIVCALGLVSKE